MDEGLALTFCDLTTEEVWTSQIPFILGRGSEGTTGVVFKEFHFTGSCGQSQEES